MTNIYFTGFFTLFLNSLLQSKTKEISINHNSPVKNIGNKWEVV